MAGNSPLNLNASSPSVRPTDFTLYAELAMKNAMMEANPRFLGRSLVVLICLTGLCCMAGAQSHQVPIQTAIAQNKSVVQRWIEEGFNRRNLKVVDEVFAESFAINGRVMRRDDLKQIMRRRFTAFPDLHVTIDEIVGDGSLVAIWYTAHGTHKAEFEGIAPTGRQVTWNGCDLLGIKEGRITQGRFVDDSLGLMRQLGATLMLPPPQK